MVHHQYGKQLFHNLLRYYAATLYLTPDWPKKKVTNIHHTYIQTFYDMFCCVNSLEGQTSIAAFQSKLKVSSLSWYDPGHSDIITRFLLNVILLPQILIPAKDMNAMITKHVHIWKSISCVSCLHLLPQCGGWCYHRCWAPLSQRCQWLERSHHGKHIHECTILLLKPYLRQKIIRILYFNEIDALFCKQNKQKWNVVAEA